MAPSGDSDADLRERIHSLAPELFNTIFDFVCAVETGEMPISPEYKPPVQLQLSRSVRETAAREYYSRSIFKGVSLAQDELFFRWLRSLSSGHTYLLRNIEVSYNDTTRNLVLSGHNEFQRRHFQLHVTGLRLQQFFSERNDTGAKSFRICIRDMADAEKSKVLPFRSGSSYWIKGDYLHYD